MIGGDVYSAYDKLRRAGFAVRIGERFDATPNHASYVRSQSPASGVKAQVGSPVSLELRGGPHGLLFGTLETVHMPLVVGKSLSDAVRMLAELNLSWGQTPFRRYPPAPHQACCTTTGSVIRSRDPERGSRNQ